MKTLVVYFSAQGHTRAIAESIAAKLGADIFEVVPEQPYTEADLDWRDDNARAAREHSDEALQNIALTNKAIDNWSDYERIILAYPVWWGTSAWAIDSFVKANQWDNKTVFPIAVSHSSPLGDSDTKLAVLAGAGNWQPGKRFSQDANESEIEEWVNSLSKL